MTDSEIIKGCLKNNRESQKALYEHYFSKMSGICLRYSKNPAEAKEMVHEGFTRVFNEIKNHKPSESLENWLKAVMIDSCIEYLSKNKGNLIVSTVNANKDAQAVKGEIVSDEEMLAKADKEIILKALQDLAPAYRKVYNLNIIDGFSHKKIAELLNISEETSELTLGKAKFSLQKNIKELIKK